MRIPYSWLLEFVELDGISPEEVADRLSLQSVEATTDAFGVELDGVVFGEVREVSKHPKRDNLWVVRVEVAKGLYVTVVTADGGLSEGISVIVALPNSKVGDRCITKREFDGVVSEGMLLSAQELGLEEASEGVLKFSEEIKPGTSAEELLGFGEKIIELDITPNRGDVLSVRGLARDLSAIFGVPKKEREIPSLPEEGNFPIEILDQDCHRYRGVVIEGVKVSDSPLEIRRRLWQAGFKSINNVVDITNYILLQEGQPLHAFDLDKISGGIVVRSAKEGERIITLDGEERDLSKEVLVIADQNSPVAVAGVIGGLESAVSSETQNILLESAYFDPKRVRRSSKKLGVQTESSYRFERNVDIEWVSKAQDLATALILQTAGGRVKTVRDIYPKKYHPKKIFLSMGKFMRYAGESYKNEEAQKILNALEIPHEIKRCGIEVFVPAHRSFDLSRDVDIIEELMRVKGYDHYTSDTLKLPTLGRLWKDKLLEVKKFLRSKGLTEVINISYEEDELYNLLGLERPRVEIINPLVPSQRFMRSSLIPSLLRTASFNESHYSYDLAIFEVGKVFLDSGEENKLGILLKGKKRLYPPEDWNAYHLKDVLEGLTNIEGKYLDYEPSQVAFLHPHVQAKVLLEGQEVGIVGKLHPQIASQLEFKREVFLAELKLEPLLSEILPKYRSLSKYPPVIRDLALLVDKNLSVSKLLNEIKSQLGDYLEDVAVFDVYAGPKVGEGKKSVGVRLTLRSLKGSLSGEEVNRLVEELVRRLKERLGVEIR